MIRGSSAIRTRLRLTLLQRGRLIVHQHGPLAAAASFSAQPRGARGFHASSADHNKEGLELNTAVAEGDLETLKELAQSGHNLSEADYNLRTPLHLSASMGDLGIVEWLLEQGADVNAEDSKHFTPLDDALNGGHLEIVRVLRQHGATISEHRTEDMTTMVLVASSSGDVDLLRELVEAGVSISKGDYDKRTPLHLAASEGQIRAVEFLLENDCGVNPIDRFGNTPLMDCRRSSGREFQAVEKILLEHGAELNTVTEYQLIVSVKHSLPVLALRGNCGFIEAFVPNFVGQELVQVDQHYNSHYALGLQDILRKGAGRIMGFSNNELEALCAQSANGHFLEVEDLQAIFAGKVSESELRDAGIEGATVVSFRIEDGSDGEVDENKKGYIVMYTMKNHSGPSDAILETLPEFTSHLINAGLFGLTKDPEFLDFPGIDPSQPIDIWREICTEGVFNSNMIYHEVSWFYEMGMQSYYFTRFSTKYLARHIHALIASKQFAEALGTPEKIWTHIENNSEFFGEGGKEQAIMMVPARDRTQAAAERALEAIIPRIPDNKSYEIEMFISKSPFLPQGNQRLALYTLQTHEYVKPVPKDSLDNDINDTSIWDVASEIFLKTKSKDVRERYQHIIEECKGKQRLSPVTEVFPPHPDGTIPIMIALNNRSGTRSYLMQMSSLCTRNNLLAERKFVETFSNGVIVYSIYIKEPESQQQITDFLQQFSMLTMMPFDKFLTPMFTEGRIAPETYTYGMAVSRFIFYFIQEKNESFDHLLNALGDDPENTNRLRLLYTGMKREAASLARIHTILYTYPEIIDELQADFKKRTTILWSEHGEPGQPTELIERINREASNPLDKNILTAFASFNLAVLKTNFYKQRKSSISFRLDPSRLGLDKDWPVVPYGMFYVLSADFQGFHVRFQDVSRGGIRLISSRDRSSYQKNASSQFAENYGLAYTQNMKNKDIPEFGSKGTILLNEHSQNSGLVSFKKYVSGLLDLMIPSEEVVDNYGQVELLFLGPDEGTADMMQTAAEYARSRGYMYWRSFTTGKPPSMGGIPHDSYGMTTRSVHQYVLGCLEKMGLPEEEVTKIQTGGPDGDLGSNEITISKDKTKAIIDGSGVIYDENGLDRGELVRLAHNRQMVEHFDAEKLGPSGFKVLVSDTNVTLPTGEVVNNGVTFRNDFHLHPLCTADLFVPCGGRPESINLQNVDKIFHTNDDGTVNYEKPKFKIIVEGANLFLTNDARSRLEKAGVVLYKDASTNKGGVTSSSLEVFAALACDDAKFARNMEVKDPSNPPEFYQKYVEEIKERVEYDARMEFECVWNAHEKTGLARHILTDIVSNKINELNNSVQNSDLYDNETIRNNVLREAIPTNLQELLGLESILERAPESYTRAIFAAYLASRYVYIYGTEADEFQFFDFMQRFQ